MTKNMLLAQAASARITGMKLEMEYAIARNDSIPDYTSEIRYEAELIQKLAESEAEVPALNNQIAAAIAHRACCGTEHDPARGKIHGYCVVCGVDWPCDTAKKYL